ncbi:MAG: Gfo/Idh/MocA family oxidoreductase [Thiolinea sp.]
MLDIVVHDIDTLRFILGSEPLEVVSLSQQAGMSQQVEDGNMAVFRFSDGLLAQVHTAFTVKYAGNGLEIHGEAGSLSVDNVLGRAASGPVKLRTAEGEQLIALQPLSLDAETVRCFVAAIQGQGEPVVDGEAGLASLAAALACLQAADTGQMVRLASD